MKISKIIIPIVIILIIGGIWINKNIQESSNAIPAQAPILGTAQESKQPTDNTAANNKTTSNSNPDFSLNAAELDLEKLKSYGLPIIIDFGAETCIPCKEMAPILTELNTKYKGKVIVKFVDISKYRELIGDFPIEVIPTQFFFDKNGKPFVPKNSEEMGMDRYDDRSGKHVYTAHKGGMTKEMFANILNELGVKD